MLALSFFSTVSSVCELSRIFTYAASVSCTARMALAVCGPMLLCANLPEDGSYWTCQTLQPFISRTWMTLSYSSRANTCSRRNNQPQVRPA